MIPQSTTICRQLHILKENEPTVEGMAVGRIVSKGGGNNKFFQGWQKDFFKGGNSGQIPFY